MSDRLVVEANELGATRILQWLGAHQEIDLLGAVEAARSGRRLVRNVGAHEVQVGEDRPACGLREPTRKRGENRGIPLAVAAPSDAEAGGALEAGEEAGNRSRRQRSVERAEHAHE